MVRSGVTLCSTARALVIAVTIASAHTQAFAAEIRVRKQGGVYTVPVRVNDTVALPFVIDSGAAEVTIPANVAGTLVRAGTIRADDLRPPGSYEQADGSVLYSQRVVLRSLDVGGVRVANVAANIVPMAGQPLLGQSFLERVGSWHLDVKRQVLVLDADKNMRSTPQGAEDSVWLLLEPPIIEKEEGHWYADRNAPLAEWRQSSSGYDGQEACEAALVRKGTEELGLLPAPGALDYVDAMMTSWQFRRCVPAKDVYPRASPSLQRAPSRRAGQIQGRQPGNSNARGAVADH